MDAEVIMRAVVSTYSFFFHPGGLGLFAVTFWTRLKCVFMMVCSTSVSWKLKHVRSSAVCQGQTPSSIHVQTIPEEVSKARQLSSHGFN